MAQNKLVKMNQLELQLGAMGKTQIWVGTYNGINVKHFVTVAEFVVLIDNDFQHDFFALSRRLIVIPDVWSVLLGDWTARLSIVASSCLARFW